MTDLIDRIGPYLGIAAFLGLAILAFLSSSRRARSAACASGPAAPPSAPARPPRQTGAVAEAKGEEAPSRSRSRSPTRAELGLWWQGVRDSLAARAAEVDRRLPVDPRYIARRAIAAVIAAAGADQRLRAVRRRAAAERRRQGHGGKPKAEKVEVAVLNATQERGHVDGRARSPASRASPASSPSRSSSPAGFKVGGQGRRRRRASSRR